MARRDPGSVYFVLSFIFLIGLSLNLFVWSDFYYLKWVFRSSGAVAGPQSTELDKLKKSIVFIGVPGCSPSAGATSGTGFVVKAGFIATAAHVIESQGACNNPIVLIDFRGQRYQAQVVGVSRETDLAILSFSELSLPPVALADSTIFERNSELSKVITIGYPLVDIGASSPEAAAVSGEGSISGFDPTTNRFVTSGLNLNPGNSGGPVFLVQRWEVLGIAIKKFNVNIGEGLGIVVPSKTFKNFFEDSTGQKL